MVVPRAAEGIEGGRDQHRLVVRRVGLGESPASGWRKGRRGPDHAGQPRL
jgi:hypothetical protein